jgi:hypothetical protein
VKHHKKLGGLDKYCIFSIAVVLLYTVVEFVFSSITQISHDTLTTCVYGFFAGEIVTLGLIKIFKLKEEKDNV